MLTSESATALAMKCYLFELYKYFNHQHHQYHHHNHHQNSFPSPFSLCSSIDLLLFLFIYLFSAAPHGMRDLRFPTTDQTVWTLCTRRQNLNHWTTREIPAYCYLLKYLYIYLFTSVWARALFWISAGHILGTP